MKKNNIVSQSQLKGTVLRKKSPPSPPNKVGGTKNLIGRKSQGFSNMKQELLDLISKVKPGILYIQETVFFLK